MYLQSIKSVKHNAAMSVNRSILKKSRHIGFGVFIVHSSMLLVIDPRSYVLHTVFLSFGKKLPDGLSLVSLKSYRYIETFCSLHF
jgi:hypothetical protein